MYLADLAATQSLGKMLAQRLFPGAVVGLIGPLGAGKTHLVRALAEGLGVEDSQVVTSPTFVLIQEYQGRMPLYHFDVYRLNDPAEFAELGAHEYWHGQGVCFIEWADKVRDYLPSDYLQLTLRIAGPEARWVEFAAKGESHSRMLLDLT